MNNARRAWGLLPLLVLPLELSACRSSPAPRPSSAPATVPVTADAPLPPPLRALEDAGATVAVHVLDAAGRTVLAHRAETLVVPASTLKVATCAALLQVAPPGARPATELRALPPAAAGVLEGNAWIVGGGDPSFGSARGQAERAEVLRRWATLLWDRGVREVRGDVVADARALDTQGVPAGWAWDDLAYGYSVPPAGLVFAEGLVRVRAVDMEDGLHVSVMPPTRLVEVMPARQVARAPGMSLLPSVGDARVTVTVRGPVGAPVDDVVAVPDPALFAAEQLARELSAVGIRVLGRARTATRHEPSPDLPVVAVDEGPTFRDLCRVTLEESLNLHAEVLLMHAGRLGGAAASTSGGVAIVKRALRDAGRDPERVRVVDGSGLSRMNLVAAADLVALLKKTVEKDPSFVELLAEMGGSGTVRSRLWGTRAGGRVRVKTGSLTGHRNLLGVVDRPDGTRLFMAIMVDGTTQLRGIVDAAVDDLVLQLVDAPLADGTVSPPARR